MTKTRFRGRLQTVGTSRCVIVPAYFVRVLGVEVGDEVEVDIRTLPEKGKGQR